MLNHLNHAACFVAQSYPTECHPSKAPQPRNYDRRQGATVEGTKGGLKRQNAWGLGRDEGRLMVDVSVVGDRDMRFQGSNGGELEACEISATGQVYRINEFMMVSIAVCCHGFAGFA